MSKAKEGDTVKVHYKGTLEDGSVFDSSEGREPLEFTVGGGHVIKGFDVAVDGMVAGDKKTVNIPIDEAYGARDENLIIVLKRDQLPQDIEYSVGVHLQLQSPEGRIFNVLVKSFTDEEVTLDSNHPLAGEALTFDIELVSIA